MTIPLPLLRRLLPIASVLLVAGLTFHWWPGHQVRLHQKHLLRAVEDRKWKTVGGFIAADYHDRWGQTKPMLMERLPQVFGDFLALGVTAENESLSRRKDGAAVVEAGIHIIGSGGPIARYIIEQSTKFQQPFSFQWRRQSWKPWDWVLIAVDQPQLEIPTEFEWK